MPIAAALLLLLGAGMALAQEAPKPVTQVLVLGDALGSGLGAGLSRMAEVTGDYEISNRFNEESGLARPEVYDWPASAAKILSSNIYDVIVVMLGANDTQAIRRDGMRIPFGAEGWAAAYAAQLDRLLAELTPSGARIIWVGPPPMREPDYDAAVRDIAAIQRARVEAGGHSFIDMRTELSGPGGAFAEYGPGETGASTRLRGYDGVSFYKAGNNRMGQIVIAALERDGPAPIDEAPPAEEVVSQVPLFGQIMMDGAAYTVRPEGVTANAVMLTAAGLQGDAALKALRGIAPAGSGAEALFGRGEAPLAPKGRADDFAVPAAAQ
jgi:hypothetical protein